MSRALWVILTSTGDLGDYAAVDTCQGVCVDADAARELAEATINEHHGNDALASECMWTPPFDVDADCYKLVFNDGNNEEVLATIEQVLLERRSAGDRRGGGR